MDEDQMLLLLRNSPSEGLEQAIASYGSCVKWITIKIIGSNNSQDIEECIADIFVKFYQSVNRYEKSRGVSLKSYLCGIARNTALDYRRKLHKNSYLVSIEENELEVSLDFVDEMAKSTNKQILQETVDQLPPPDREIFIMRYYWGEKVAAIAEILGINAKTVENKLYRGKQKLKSNLLERGVIL